MMTLSYTMAFEQKYITVPTKLTKKTQNKNILPAFFLLQSFPAVYGLILVSLQRQRETIISHSICSSRDVFVSLFVLSKWKCSTLEPSEHWGTDRYLPLGARGQSQFTLLLQSR